MLRPLEVPQPVEALLPALEERLGLAWLPEQVEPAVGLRLPGWGWLVARPVTPLGPVL